MTMTMKNSKSFYEDLLVEVKKASNERLNEIEELIKEDLIAAKSVETTRAAKKAKAQQAKTKAEQEKKVPKYKYPFTIHLAGKNLETDHIFNADKEYKEDEIKTKMLEHQYYDFAGSVSFTYIEKENVLLPVFQQHKKG